MRDYEYFKSLYPMEVKRLQVFAEAAVDEMDYEGSPIYDEYPERLFLEQLTRRAAEHAGINMDLQGKCLENETAENVGTKTSAETGSAASEMIWSDASDSENSRVASLEAGTVWNGTADNENGWSENAAGGTTQSGRAEKGQIGNTGDGSSRIFWNNRIGNRYSVNVGIWNYGTANAETGKSAVPRSVEIEGNGYRMWEPMDSVQQGQEMQTQEQRNRPPQSPPWTAPSGGRPPQSPPWTAPPEGRPPQSPLWNAPPEGRPPQSPPPWTAPSGGRPPQSPPPPNSSLQRDLLNVLLLHELQQRRCCRRGSCS